MDNDNVDNDLTKAKSADELCFELFKESGQIGYYMLYKDLIKKKNGRT